MQEEKEEREVRREETWKARKMWKIRDRKWRLNEGVKRKEKWMEERVEKRGRLDEGKEERGNKRKREEREES